VQKPAIPPTESQRLQTLRGLGILDTLPEERFDRITRLARRLFGVPIALISLVDAERQWFKSNQGLPATETGRDVSFCGHAVADDELLVVPDALADERFMDNPLVVGDPGIRFYAGCPVHAGEGFPIGTVCLIDRERRELSAEDILLLRDLAAMVEDELHMLREATTDELTGLSNRRGFESLATKALALSRRLGATTSLLSFDLDGFKRINDEHGHATGDRALVDFASALLTTFRDADVIARLGGDEFCVLGWGAPDAMTVPLARLTERLAAITDRPYQVAYSVGIVAYQPELHPSLTELLANADRAMYTDKRTG